MSASAAHTPAVEDEEDYESNNSSLCSFSSASSSSSSASSTNSSSSKRRQRRRGSISAALCMPALRDSDNDGPALLTLSAVQRLAGDCLRRQHQQQPAPKQKRLRLSAAAVRALRDAAEACLADVFDTADVLRRLQGRQTLQLDAFRVAASIIVYKK